MDTSTKGGIDTNQEMYVGSRGERRNTEQTTSEGRTLKQPLQNIYLHAIKETLQQQKDKDFIYLVKLRSP
jgi:hypothetical protein